ELTQIEAAKPVSRAHLPRLLDRLDWPVLNRLVERCFGVRVGCDGAQQAVRGHWGVESNNWIRDVTFKEDGVKTKAGNQAQVMGLLRGIAIELIRKTMPKNFQAAIDKFVDSSDALESILLQANFL
ncbi:MAG: hypothetical protein NTX45_01055, partial [Proteobacteria bacterium]|nr:hypothetical protein [Pseudomonadota bacterium]